MARLVIVTGANRGLGYEVTKKFVSNGDKVLLTCRNQEAGAAAAKKIEESTDSQATVAVYSLDITSSESVDRFVEFVKEDYDGQLDILVNNAGIYEEPWTQEVYDRTINVNVHSPVHLTQRIAPYMAEGGRVVMVSSELSRIVEGSAYNKMKVSETIEDLLSTKFMPEDSIKSMGAPAYCVSKLMLNVASKILSQSPALTERKITIDCVDPGWCRTDMGSNLAPRSPEEGAADIYRVANLDPPTTGMYYDSAGSVKL